ncbi:MAG: hypothetical protein SGJ09_14770 [Phycisphaerae bacterium]|nr:hypothetical protein [Phycisphaerae bacterium]
MAVDVASRILDTPVSAKGRAAAIAAAAPLVVPWMAAIRAAAVQRMRAQLEDVAAQRPIVDGELLRRGDNVRLRMTSEEFVRADEAARAMLSECNRAAEAIESAVLAATAEELAGASEDVLRYRLSFACIRRPDLCHDLRPLWTESDRSIECVPADRRGAVRAAAMPILEELEARVERLRLFGAAMLGPDRTQGDDPLTDARMQLRSTTSVAAAIAAARLDSVFPQECWDRSSVTEKSFALRATLERLGSKTPTTPTPQQPEREQ